MPESVYEAAAIWGILWKSLVGSRYDIDMLKAKADNDSDFVEDLGIDSLDLLEFYLRLGESYKLDLTEDDYMRLTSVENVTLFLRGRAAFP
jgi:acyl carrier protein